MMKIEMAPTRNVAARWKAQYEIGGKWRRTASGDSHETYKRLLALGDNPSADDVAKIISISWVSHWCEGCNNWHRVAVKFGDDGCLCFECVRKAMDLVNSVMVEKPDAGAAQPKERLIEVLRSVNGHVWPGASESLAMAAMALSGKHMIFRQEMLEGLRAASTIHQSPHIRSLATDALRYLEGTPNG